jgi:hypothetical protein
MTVHVFVLVRVLDELELLPLVAVEFPGAESLQEPLRHLIKVHTTDLAVVCVRAGDDRVW